MNDFAFVSTDMHGAALPGTSTSTASYFPELAGLWELGIRGWAEAVEGFGGARAGIMRVGAAR